MDTLDKECPVCGTYFVGRSDKQYCSGRCRVKAHRQAELDPEWKEEEIEQTVDRRSPLRITRKSDTDLPWEQSALPVTRPEPTSPEEKPIDIRALVNQCFSRYEAQEAAHKLRRQQEAEADLAQEIHTVYVQAIECFLDGEGQQLNRAKLQGLANRLLDARENYKAHPYLNQSNQTVRHRLNDLRDALRIVQETLQEIQQRWLSNKTGQYDLKGKWRKQLRERLLL